MADSLTGTGEAVYQRLCAYQGMQEAALEEYKQLLIVMMGHLKNGKTDNLAEYGVREQQLLDRLGSLEKVMIPLKKQLAQVPRFSQRLKEKEASFSTLSGEVKGLLDDLRELLQEQMEGVSRSLSALRAMPRRPLSFSSVDEPSRLDIKG